MSTDILWSSLFIPSEDDQQIYERLQTFFQKAGYQAYNPYPGGTGTPKNVTELNKLFVRWGENGWTRLLVGILNPTIIPNLRTALQHDVLWLWVSSDMCDIQLFGASDLADYLRDGSTLEQLEAARQTTYDDQSTDLTTDFAQRHGVKPKQFNKLFQRTKRQIDEKLDDVPTTQPEAKQAFSWGLASAQKLATMASYLTLPENWQEPSYETLSAAYRIACILDENEDAFLLPGDDDLLDAVEFPLDYHLAHFAR